jgi:hypothetical protein
MTKEPSVETKKLILDLCGGTGSWSAPWKDAGYEVEVVTIPEKDVRTYEPPDNVYGILAAPPCTMFSDARTNAKTPRDLRGGMEVVEACLRIIRTCQYRTISDQQKYPPLKFWALENPYYGRLKWFLGKPVFVFDPWEFGDPYKKKTAIWGYFNEPVKTHKDITEVLNAEQIEKHKTNSQSLPKFDYMASKDIHPEYFGTFDRQTRRSITPKGFAKAFYEANKKEEL